MKETDQAKTASESTDYIEKEELPRTPNKETRGGPDSRLDDG